jgi:hypothetical protein
MLKMEHLVVTSVIFSVLVRGDEFAPKREKWWKRLFQQNEILADIFYPISSTKRFTSSDTPSSSNGIFCSKSATQIKAQ